jgi:hypothetical protein
MEDIVKPRIVPLVIAVLILSWVLVGAGIYYFYPADGSWTVQAVVVAAMLGAGVVVLVLQFLPTQPTWGERPRPSVGLTIAVGLLTVGTVEAAAMAGVRVPYSSALIGVGTVLLTIGTVLYSRGVLRAKKGLPHRGPEYDREG